MRKDIFILIIGYGRTGTSLCTGLLNSSPNLNLGYELNNSFIYSPKKEKFLNGDKIGSLEDIPILSKEFNGNKIAINASTSLFLVKLFIEKKVGFIHDQFDTLKIIFTERDTVDTLVSRKKRVMDKGVDLPMKEMIRDYLMGMFMIKELKLFCEQSSIDWYVFDFDVLLDGDTMFFSQRLFGFVGEIFKGRYVLDYKGIKNYSHARGVKRENVLFGHKEKFPKLRAEIIEALSKEKEFI